MNNTEYQNRIYSALGRKIRFITPIFTSPHEVPERLKELDPDLFLVFNSKKQWYEVHNLSHKDGNTYGFRVPYDELDYRTVKLARENDLRYNPTVLDDVEKYNDWIEKENQRIRSDELRDVGERMYKSVSKLAWEGA